VFMTGKIEHVEVITSVQRHRRWSSNGAGAIVRWALVSALRRATRRWGRSALPSARATPQLERYAT
jgi:hypothetical protein